MYEIGELIFYGDTGVCTVADITAYNLPEVEKDLLYYVLKPLYHDYVIYAPVNTAKVYMRPIITKEEAERLIGMILSIHMENDHSNAFLQHEEYYESLLKSHDCTDLIELTNSLYKRKQVAEQQKRKFGATNERFMKRAEELLFGEIAAALGIEKDKVPEYIASKVDEGGGNSHGRSR